MRLVWFIISFFDLNHFAVCVGYLQLFEHHSSALYRRNAQQKSTKTGKDRRSLSWVDIFGDISVGIRTV